MDFLYIVLSKALLVLLVCSGIPMLASSLAGLVIAIFQAATQVQEQSFVFLAKISAFVIVIVLSHKFLWNSLANFVEEMLLAITSLGKLV